MLDRDLAKLYNTETRSLNQAVRRNKDRFPPDFMIELTREEIMNLSQTVISSKIKHAPHVFAFTQEGVAMLSSVLRSPQAIAANIAIMRAFIHLRQIISSNKELAMRLNELERHVRFHDEEIQSLVQAYSTTAYSGRKTEKKNGISHPRLKTKDHRPKTTPSTSLRASD